jgi:molybdate transport system ATP-binding protein
MHAPFTGTNASRGSVDWAMHHGEHWAIVGDNGAGKTTMALALRQEAAFLTGSVVHAEECGPTAIGIVSFEEQCKLFLRQQQEYETAVFAAGGRHPPAITAGQVVGGRLAAAVASGVPSTTTTLAAALGLDRLLGQPFVTLSSGEHRRLLIGEALSASPRVLILDEPFDGLDKRVRQEVQDVLEEAGQQTSMILITHRAEEIPSYVTHAAVLGGGSIRHQGTRTEMAPHLCKLDHCAQKQSGDGDTAATASHQPPTFTQRQLDLVADFRAGGLQVDGTTMGEATGDILLDMQDVAVTYGDREILPRIKWQVRAGEHWAVTGPNGCGKSTLVRLAYSDHPQRYSNDIRIMGNGKGAGQSIWQLRSRIGIVTPWLHLQHHGTPFSAFAVVCSGFFDSTGLWQVPTPRQVEVATKWVELFGLELLVDRPFPGLSQGQQRLILLARAVVKAPRLVLLDEPTHGLDAENRRRFLELVDLISERCSVVLVTHHLDEVGTSVTHHLELAEDGSIESQGPIRH